MRLQVSFSLSQIFSRILNLVFLSPLQLPCSAAGVRISASFGPPKPPRRRSSFWIDSSRVFCSRGIGIIATMTTLRGGTMMSAGRGGRVGLGAGGGTRIPILPPPRHITTSCRAGASLVRDAARTTISSPLRCHHPHPTPRPPPLPRPGPTRTIRTLVPTYSVGCWYCTNPTRWVWTG